MQSSSIRIRNERVGIAAALGGLLATIAAGAACLGPLIAILLGLSGFGWLTRFAALRVPAALISLLLVGVGFYCAYARHPARCEHARRTRLLRGLSWLALACTVVILATEFFLLEHLF